MNLERAASSENPVTDAEKYKEIEAAIASKRAELATASIDEMTTLVTEIQALETQKGEAFDSSYQQAQIENERIDTEQAALEAAHDEAHAENFRRDEEETKRGEETAKIDAEIAEERAKLSGASAEALGAIVARLKELEQQKLSGRTNVEEAEVMIGETTEQADKDIDRLKINLVSERYQLEADQKELDTDTRWLDRNKRAEAVLQDHLNLNVRESSVSSMAGGTEWELVDKTRELQSLIEQKNRANINSDEQEVLWEKIRALSQENVSNMWGGGNEEHWKILVSGPSGDIGSKEIMTLGEAFGKSNALYESRIEELKEKVASRQQKIQEFESELELLAA